MMPFHICVLMFFVTAVIYHYCVIVEMFCIGLYARHTFRKVEPNVVKDEEVPVGIWQMEKAVQTDDVDMNLHKPRLLSEEAWQGYCFTNTSNPSYNSTTEDSLCRIEHAPLDIFLFPQPRGLHSGTPEGLEHSASMEPGMNLSHVTVRAEINYQASKDVTMVWSTVTDLSNLILS